jgi:hypothetical protein
MAQSAANIHVGPGRIWTGVTAPASGAPPTWMTHTAGVPATGTEIGFTASDSTFTWNTEKSDIEAEQAIGVVDQFISKESAQLEFEALEREYNLLKACFDNIGNVNDVTRMGFYGGGGGTILNITYVTVCLTSQIRNLTGKYEVLVMYKAVSMNAMVLTWSRTKPSSYKVTLRGLPDTTRTAGDQIFQFSREK